MSPNRAEAKTILRLALPVVSTQVAFMLMGVIDTLMVSRLGTRALAAATLGNLWVFGTFVFFMGLLMGLDPIISQAHGARDGARVGLALQRGLVLSLLASLPLAALWALTGPVLRLAGQEADLAALAQGFAVVQIPSIPAFLAFTAMRQYLTGRGIMKPAMWIAWAANVVNLFFNWVLIYGHLGFTARGVMGSGMATAIARVFMLFLLTAFIYWGRLHEGAWTGWTRRAFELRGLVEVLAFGVPVAAQIGLEVWGFQVATLLAGKLSATALAAHSIVLTVASFSFMFPLGISIAAATRVGNLIGAREPEAAERAAWVAIALGAGVMSAFGVAFFFSRHALPGLWAPAPDVLAAAAAILPIAAAWQIFDGTQAVACGIMRGMGDTRPAAWFNLAGYFGMALPLGAWLAFRRGWGLPGIWWGLTLALAVVALMLVRRLRVHGPATVTPLAR